jgi:cell division protein FtsZ
VELIAVNTDAQALHFCKASQKILIGKEITKGLGTGMDLNLGKLAAKENEKEIEEVLKEADMVFVTCGLGGGTGSGAAPVIAEISKNLGILTVTVVTTPFSFEGAERKKIAEQALENFKEKTDSLLVISNDKLLKIIDEKTTVANAFNICDEILKEAVQGITDLILVPGIINIDFASVLSIMKNSGHALFGVGRAIGENRAIEAANKAISSPLLDFSIKGSKGVLFNVSGTDITLNEIQQAANIITKNVDPRAQIIFGAVKPPKGSSTLKKGEIKISVIATKF